jgi:D-sedoheptulose 7-phosphate isomerase
MLETHFIITTWILLMQNISSRNWQNFCAHLAEILSKISFCSLAPRAENFQPDEGFVIWARLLLELKKRGGNLYCIGNGASSALCSHFSADISKNVGIRAHVFTDAALLTAVGNDISFEQIFAEPLLRQGLPGDALLTVSSSGNSANILAGIAAARKIGFQIITLSAMHMDNASRELGDLNIYVPAPTYGLAETAHAAILHHVTDILTYGT